MVVETVVDIFGPFLIPAVIFVAGGLAYAVLILLTRWGVLPADGETPPEGPGKD